MDEIRTDASPATDDARRRAFEPGGPWWGAGALGFAVLTLLGALVGLWTDTKHQMFMGNNDPSLATRIELAASQLATVVALLVLVSLFSDDARGARLARIAAAVWLLAAIIVTLDSQLAL